MIESIHIKNFQVHKDTKVDLAHPVSMFVGPSDVGKSAVLRALWWVLSNTPSGDAFVRHGAKVAEVTVKVDGHEITRRRGGSVNTYTLDGQELKAFGSDVPMPIKRILRIDADNFQDQHAAPYWLSDTAGQVSRNLNTIIDLGIMDDAVGKAVGVSKTMQAKVSLCEERLNDAKATKEALKWVPLAADDLKQLETHHTLRTHAAETVENLARLLRTAKEQRSTCDQLGQALQDATRLRGLCVVAGKLGKRRNQLAGLLSMAKKQAAVADTRPDLAPVTKAVSAWRNIHSDRIQVQTILKQVKLLHKERADVRTALTAAKKRYTKIRKEKCPLCGKS